MLAENDAAAIQHPEGTKAIEDDGVLRIAFLVGFQGIDKPFAAEDVYQVPRLDRAQLHGVAVARSRLRVRGEIRRNARRLFGSGASASRSCPGSATGAVGFVHDHASVGQISGPAASERV